MTAPYTADELDAAAKALADEAVEATHRLSVISDVEIECKCGRRIQFGGLDQHRNEIRAELALTAAADVRRQRDADLGGGLNDTQPAVRRQRDDDVQVGWVNSFNEYLHDDVTHHSNYHDDCQPVYVGAAPDDSMTVSRDDLRRFIEDCRSAVSPSIPRHAAWCARRDRLWNATGGGQRD